MKKKPAGLTLVEILVVMAVIAVLVAILLPSLSRSRQFAYRISCLNNLKQLGVAVEAYVQTYGYYPVCVPSDTNERWSDFVADKSIAANKMLGVPVSLWPFHKSDKLYNCPVLVKLDCDISYCYNWLAGRVLDETETIAALTSSDIRPDEPIEPARKKVQPLSPEKVKRPTEFVLLYDQPVKPDLKIGGYDSYKDIDPDDRESDENEPNQMGHLWHYKVLGAVGPHGDGHDILFADGHVKWHKKRSDSSISRNPF